MCTSLRGEGLFAPRSLTDLYAASGRIQTLIDAVNAGLAGGRKAERANNRYSTWVCSGVCNGNTCSVEKESNDC